MISFVWQEFFAFKIIDMYAPGMFTGEIDQEIHFIMTDIEFVTEI